MEGGRAVEAAATAAPRTAVDRRYISWRHLIFAVVALSFEILLVQYQSMKKYERTQIVLSTLVSVLGLGMLEEHVIMYIKRGKDSGNIKHKLVLYYYLEEDGIQSWHRPTKQETLRVCFILPYSACSIYNLTWIVKCERKLGFLFLSVVLAFVIIVISVVDLIWWYCGARGTTVLHCGHSGRYRAQPRYYLGTTGYWGRHCCPGRAQRENPPPSLAN